MKNILLSILLFSGWQASGQLSFAEWTRSITALPDSVNVAPVSVETDETTNDVVVLCNVFNQTGQSEIVRVNRYSGTGQLVWSFDFDNNGTGNPRGYSLDVDTFGNSYIAGGFLGSPNFEPFFMKLSPGGSLIWMRDSISAITDGYLGQVIATSQRVYLSGTSGVAIFDVNGMEVWSQQMLSQAMTVDHGGKMIVAGMDIAPNTLFRFDMNGNQEWSDSTILAKRITVDLNNNIYLLSDFGMYEMVAYDSAGNFKWYNNNFPPTPPFGDIGMEVISDLYRNVYAVGLNDTIFKFDPAGNQLWAKPMFGLDSYIINAEVHNFLGVVGSVQGFGSPDGQVNFFDMNGNISWTGINTATTDQEFAVDLSINPDGIYMLEDSAGSTLLVKFPSPFFSQEVNFNLMCVDSVWYDPNDPNIINVQVFNGNVNHLNYPSIQIISPSGDTIGNPSNFVNFFAHLGNMPQVYSDTITVQGITDFSNYTFLMHQGFGDTSGVIGFCAPLGLEETDLQHVLVFPNPADEYITVLNLPEGKSFIAEIFDQTGRVVSSTSIKNGGNTDVSELPPGMYFLRISSDKSIRVHRLLVR